MAHLRLKGNEDPMSETCIDPSGYLRSLHREVSVMVNDSVSLEGGEIYGFANASSAVFG